MKIFLAALVIFSLTSVVALAQEPTATPTGPPPATASPTATTPSASPTATPSPTPTTIPMPSGVTVTVSAILLGEDNVPLPPERQVHTVIVTWQPVAGATGYEVGKADATFVDALEFARVATVAASGPFRFEEPYPFLTAPQWCYAVRAVAAGQVGARSDARCTPRLPQTGPSPLAPAPPDTGNGHSAFFDRRTGDSTYPAVATGALVLLVGAVGVLAVSLRLR